MGLKQRWDTASRNERIFVVAVAGTAALLAPATLASLETDMADRDANHATYGAQVEERVMGGFGATTPDELCADGITWACPITGTIGHSESGVDVNTTLTQADTREADRIARAYLTTDHTLTAVWVNDRTGTVITALDPSDVGR